MAGQLETYKAKRDFTKTAEPSGKAKVAKSDQPRFVIQKHAASRLHYDLRLEHDGVFKSWAVTKGPSLDPHEKRLAVEVEDHPLDYGDFEGTIPKGQYGGGTVMLWDRGWWEPEPGKTVAEALKKGHLSFTFHGERLKGGWHLVRIRNDRNGGKRNNWLLIKQDDETAHAGDHDALLEDTASSVASGRAMETIAEGKGRAPKPFITTVKRAARAIWNSKDRGVTAPEEAKSFAKPKAAKAKAAPLAKGKPVKRMPEFAEPQLTRLVDRPPAQSGWVHEIKFDGYRMQARVADGEAVLRTRKGLDWTERFIEIAKACAALPDCMIDGEICAMDAHDRPDFAGLQAALSSGKTGKLVFFVFDALFVAGEDLRALPLRDRKARLAALVKGAGARLRFVDHFETAGDAVLKSACRMDLEGVVSKRLDAPYRSGRNDDWTKAKCRGGQEVIVAGWTTTGSAFRSLIAGVMRDGQLVHVGRIGTGYGQDKVKALLPQLKKLETKTSPFSGPGAPKGGAGVHWVKPELVAEIGFAGWTGEGHLRQASFKALREDKPAREVREEDPVPVKDVEKKVTRAVKAATAKVPAKALAKSPAARAKTPPSADRPIVRGVTISHPEKVLWPAHGAEPAVTKLDHARYIEAVSEWMLPYVKGRPASIIRTPEGIGGEAFFQRHAGLGTSSLITLTTVSGDKKPYLQFDTVEALVAAAQSGATEIHPWQCLPGNPELPGRFVFDLDPDEGLPFERVIEAAKDVRDRLSAVGLESLLKTTGGKGLHVVTIFTQPKGKPIEWAEAKAFAQTLCAQMVADSPDRYVINMAKAKRTGKIFLDYLRNDRTSSAVALLSARARPGAPVSMPLSWSQAKKGLDPKAYTVRTAPALMKKRDPWAGWEETARPLKDAIRKLGKIK